MEQLHVPATVATAVAERWPLSGRHWAEAAERELVELLAQHELHPIRVLPARFGYVVEARGAVGDVVLRSSPDPDAPKQAAVAQVLADLGVSPAIRSMVTTHTAVWTIMDKVDPGTSLYQVDPTSIRLEDVVTLLRPMVGQPAPSGLPDISAWLSRRLTDPDIADLPPGRGPAPLFERTRGLELLEQLLRDGGCTSLCHGDVSRGNVLLGKDRLWLIDPRGVTGEVEYDAGVLALRFARYDPDAAELVAISLADGLAIDPQRAAAWSVIAAAARV